MSIVTTAIIEITASIMVIIITSMLVPTTEAGPYGLPNLCIHIVSLTPCDDPTS